LASIDIQISHLCCLLISRWLEFHLE